MWCRNKKNYSKQIQKCNSLNEFKSVHSSFALKAFIVTIVLSMYFTFSISLPSLLFSLHQWINHKCFFVLLTNLKHCKNVETHKRMLGNSNFFVSSCRCTGAGTSGGRRNEMNKIFIMCMRSGKINDSVAYNNFVGFGSCLLSISLFHSIFFLCFIELMLLFKINFHF